MNARHTHLISTVAALALLVFGTSAALAERRDQSKHSGQPPTRINPGHVATVRVNPSHVPTTRIAPVPRPSYTRQIPTAHAARSNLAHSSVHPTRPGYQVHRAEATYRHPYPVHPVHRYPSGVIVARPVFVYPPVVYDATCIRIVNPAEVGVTVSYTLDGQQVLLQPGEIQMLHRRYVIMFDRGNGYGFSQLVLTGGTYTFGLDSDGGWSLFRS